MAVAYVSGNGAVSSVSSSVDTASFVIGSQTDKVLVAIVVWNTPVAETVSSVVWNPTGVNQSLTAFGSVFNAGNYYARAYHLINPGAATSFVRVTWSGSTIGSQGVGAAFFSGAHQTTPLSDQTTANGTSATPTLAGITAAGDDDYLVDGVLHEISLDSVGAGQTAVFNTGGFGCSVQDGATAGDVMSWDTGGASGTWAQLGVRVAAAGGASETITLDKWQGRYDVQRGQRHEDGMIPSGFFPPERIES